MKNLLLLITILLVANYSNAQIRELSWYKTGTPNDYYTTDDFGFCGNPSVKTFRVSYSHCPTIFGSNCIPGCGANPIRYTVDLQRNGVTISSRTFQASSDWTNALFYNTTAYAATYRAYVKVERRKLSCFFGWETVSTGYTNTITVSPAPATPHFNVNGFVPLPKQEAQACISNIRINAAATTCETDYYIGVQEVDQWHDRTYDYEWGGWISGQAPNNINLQSLATTFGVNSRYMGTDLSREGDILIGGNLPSGGPRFYRVSVCTGVPSWQCKSILIKVLPECRIDPSTIIEDTNEYIWGENDDFVQKLKDENIEVSFEADVDENITAFETQVVSNVNIAPNPFSSTTIVSIDNYKGKSPILFELYNTLGERVTSIQTNKTQFELQRNQLSAGIYMYRATVDNELLGSGKVVIE